MDKPLKAIDPTISCSNCGGSLRVGETVCEYCQTKYDRDLSRLKYGMEKEKSGRNCPCCEKELQSIDLEIGYKFIVERCQECLGIFMDKLELEEFLKWAANHPGEVDTPRLLELLHCPERPWEKVNYRKCPVCAEMMARKNFGRRSGIIIDICHKHGTWLDAGELNQLLKWSGAGGQESKCLLQAEKERIAKEAQKIRRDNAKSSSQTKLGLRGRDSSSMVDALSTLFKLN